MKYFFSILTILMLAGCSMVEDPGKPCTDPNGSDNVVLSFKMLSDAPMLTRADDQNHNEVDSELESLEDGIDVNDLGIFVFAKAEGATDEKGDPMPENLILKTTDLGQSTDPTMMISGSPGSYTVTMVFKRDELQSAIDMEITESGSTRVQFRIVILANCSSPGTDAQAKWNQINGKTYTEVINQLNDWNYAMSYLYNSSYTGDDAVGLYTTKSKSHIPMFGSNLFYATQEALYNSRPDDRVYMGEISMLRALAKVRVIDNIRNKEADGYPQIIGAEFVGSQDMAKQLPYSAVSYKNGNQVHFPNISSPNNSLDPESPLVYRLGTISPGLDMTPADERKGITRIGYVPEQRIRDINAGGTQKLPMIRVKVALSKNADGTFETNDYEVPMKGSYEGQPSFEFGDNILRNHIYSLSVNYVAMGTPADITISVDEWKEEDPFELDFSQTVLFRSDGKMEWVDGTYKQITAEGNVEALPWKTNADGTSSPVPMVCTFGFQTPLGATWRAFFIGEGDAFNFVDEDGNVIGEHYVEGTIDNKLATLRIVTTDEHPTENHFARLQVVVFLLDGSVIEPHMANQDNYDTYTVYQNQE